MRRGDNLALQRRDKTMTKTKIDILIAIGALVSIVLAFSIAGVTEEEIAICTEKYSRAKCMHILRP